MRKMLLGILFMSACVWAEDEQYYCKAAREFINKNGSADSEKSWEKKWKSRCETANNDNGEDEEQFINRYIYDWMAGRADSFAKNKLTIEEKLTACRLYLIYKNVNADGSVRRKGANDHKYKIPDRIAEYLTNENLDKFINDDPSLAQKLGKTEEQAKIK